MEEAQQKTEEEKEIQSEGEEEQAKRRSVFQVPVEVLQLLLEEFWMFLKWPRWSWRDNFLRYFFALKVHTCYVS